MDSISDHVEQEQEQMNDTPNETDQMLVGGAGGAGDGESAANFITEFDLTVGRTRIYDEDAESYHWLWKAKADDGHECVSGTIFDAIMGVIEEISDGEV